VQGEEADDDGHADYRAPCETGNRDDLASDQKQRDDPAEGEAAPETKPFPKESGTGLSTTDANPPFFSCT
jgi:hypothetical protein